MILSLKTKINEIIKYLYVLCNYKRLLETHATINNQYANINC